MRTFREHLEEKLKDPEFKRLFEEERQKLRLAYQVRNARIRKGLTQRELAKLAGVTQQMISRIENATAPNLYLGTVMKVARALGFDIGLISSEETKRAATIKRA